MIGAHTNPPLLYKARSEGRGRRGFVAVVRETSPAGPPRPRLLDRVRAAARFCHYSRRTEGAYVAWIRRYIFFHGKRHPAELGAAEVTRFLSSLAVDGRVAASTQNQALGALLFLYVTMLPAVVKAGLVRHLESVRTQHQRDLHQGAGWVELPTALVRKSGNGCFQRRGPTATARRASGADITFTSPCSSAS